MRNKKIILCPNPERDVGFTMTQKAAEIMKRHNRETVICPAFNDELVYVPKGMEISALEDELSEAEMIITFGGDGTILKTARSAAVLGVPILGVNMGGVGFMADLETDDVDMIETAASGGYRIDRRMMLDIELVRDEKIIYRDFALNDVVISGTNKVIDLTLFGNGQKILHFAGDGTVVATPTGSTAYSMAAGGPIVEPAAYNIIVTPICAHVLEAKPMVLAPERKVSVEIGYKKSNPAYMSVDGGDTVAVQSGDIVNVQKSEKYTNFIRLSNRSFYTMVSEKLGEKI